MFFGFLRICRIRAADGKPAVDQWLQCESAPRDDGKPVERAALERVRQIRRYVAEVHDAL